MTPAEPPATTEGQRTSAMRPVPAPTTTRRAVVRRSAVVLAGAVGVLAAPTLVGTATADPGDPVQLGGRNKAGDAQTRLQAETTVAVLSVLNERVRREESIGEVDLIAPQLRLAAPIPGASRPQVPDVASMEAGDLAAAGGLLYFGAEAGDFDVLPSQVFTSTFANYLQPVDPARATVLDTRTLTRQQRLAYQPGDFAADGRLAAERRIAVDLRSLVNTTSVAPRAGVALSLQLLAAADSGVLRLFHDPVSPDGLEVLSCVVLPAAVTANATPFPLPASGAALVGLDRDDRLWLSLSTTAHVVVRVSGLFIADPSAVVDAPATTTDDSTYTRRVQRQRAAMRRLTAGIRLST